MELILLALISYRRYMKIWYSLEPNLFTVYSYHTTKIKVHNFVLSFIWEEQIVKNKKKG